MSERDLLHHFAVPAILQMVVQEMSAIWWVCDHELRVIANGGPMQELTGRAPSSYIGIRLDQRDVDPEIRDRGTEAMRRALAGETVRYSAEWSGRVFDTTVSPLQANGNKYGFGISIDVTRFRALEHRMVEAQRAESLGVLAGGLAHDFNNLLVAILGNADLGLRDIKPGAPGRSALENIRQASLRAAELTNQLLAYAGRGGTSQQRVLTKPIVDELLQITHRPGDSLRIDVVIPPGLAIRGDESQFRQVLINLISNAREAYGDAGGNVTIKAVSTVVDGSIHPDDVLSPSAGPYVKLTVSDDGPGMSGEVRRRIFDPFFTTKHTGHGLGLAAVLGIVRAHGGGIRLRTAPGVGAAFDILWPATATPVQQAAATEPQRTILVIDDEDLVRDVLARMLEDLGYRALTAADGPSGLAIVAAESPDAVLVDLTMPRMSGAEVVAKLRVTTPALPIILCSGYDRDGHGPVDATAYLPKPFRMEALEQILATLFA